MATSTTVMRAVGLSTRLSRSLLSSRSSRCSSRMSTKADKTEAEEPVQKEAGQTQENEVKAAEQMTAQVKKLEEDIKEMKDKHLRALAESENLRRRMTKQVDDAKLYGIQGFCKDLLEVSDILSTAVTAVPKEELKDSNPHLVSLYEGLNMTESQLVKVFKKHGLESISPKEGEKFDPNIHEALFQVPIQAKETQEADTVAIVQKIGFRLHSRTLRPALVGVFKS
ncbi:grpE protein homolog 1, mitochondrial [Aplysia californica]|uniref:GrpE protein homolog 1, mitochondrial n=1 Tax=Aplysia californica TaxID=6500 RepID=A0ABM0JBP8_APLCA|nr:grpE protein homolog 1, mitochondrial [Aplysia californica]